MSGDNFGDDPPSTPVDGAPQPDFSKNPLFREHGPGVCTVCHKKVDLLVFMQPNPADHQKFAPNRQPATAFVLNAITGEELHSAEIQETFTAHSIRSVLLEVFHLKLNERDRIVHDVDGVLYHLQGDVLESRSGSGVANLTLYIGEDLDSSDRSISSLNTALHGRPQDPSYGLHVCLGCRKLCQQQ